MLSSCEYCGSDFISRPAGHRLADGRWAVTRFCSRRCSYDARVTRKSILCEYCGRLFEVAQSRSPRFCSRECLFDSMKRRRVVSCVICGKEFSAQEHLFRKNRAKVCSMECKGELQSQIRGDKHPFWKGGKSWAGYTREWRATLKKYIRDRDDNACKICGTHRLLVVHHIDEDKKNCHTSNLITLCRSCHMKVHYGELKMVLAPNGGFTAW